MYRRSLAKVLWYDFVRVVIRVFATVVFRFRVLGVENIPAEGGVLVVSNHQSHLDPPLIGAASSRRMNFLARLSLFDFAPFALLIRSFDAIPIDREGLGLGGIKESLKRLKRGEMVLIFPEGTRTPDGEIQSFRPGFTTLAVRSKSAILPLALDGAYQAFPKTRRFPRPGKIRLLFGKPILLEEYEGIDERELVKLVERRVRECFAELENRAAGVRE